MCHTDVVDEWIEEWMVQWGEHTISLFNVWKSSPLLTEHKSVRLSSVASWDLVLDYFSTSLLRQLPTPPILHSHLSLPIPQIHLELCLFSAFAHFLFPSLIVKTPPNLTHSWSAK